LSVTITAEGIERTSQLEWLRKRGCHEAQGFLLSRPLSAGDLEGRFMRRSDQSAETDREGLGYLEG
jgi:EAL domain-containing protein (putative c-di-GMP-specific phosphodiesterase class I)